MNDGTSDSAANYTMTIDVTEVNDPPTAADSRVTTAEDNAYTFTAGDFNFSDVDAGDALSGVKITSLPTAGTFTLDGATVTANQAVPRADIDAGKLSFTPAPNASGDPYASFIFRVNDGIEDSAASYTMTIGIGAANDPPTAADNTVTTAEDNAYIFTVDDFNFSDPDGDTLSSVKVVSLPPVGTLALDGATPTANQVVAKADIDAGKLRFTPAANTGGVYASFAFRVNDGTDDSVAHTMTVSVAAANDTPTSADKTVTTAEDTAYTFTADDFDFSDPDAGDSLSGVKIVSLPSVGTLALDGAALTANQTVPRADIDAGKLSFTPAPNANGPAYASFTFRVSDGTDDSTDEYAMTMDVTAVNDAPTGLPTVTGTGTLRAEQTLTADTTGIADADGLTQAVYSYQWVRVDGGTDTEIADATDNTYRVVAADQGKKIRVRVTFTDDGGTEEMLTSAAYPDGNDTGTGDADAAAAVTGGPPDAPVNLRAEPGDGQVALAWQAPESDGGSAIIRYEVESSSSGAWIDAGMDLRETVMGLTNGRPYTFSVRAVNAIGAGPAVTLTAVPDASFKGPLRAWLSRFGRTVGSQVVEAVNTRLNGIPADSHLTVGGVRLGGSEHLDTAVLRPQDWLAAQLAKEPDAYHPEERTLTTRQLLLGSSFHLVSDAEKHGDVALSAWGRVSAGNFRAEVDDLTMDGDVTTGLLGFDAKWKHLLAGLLLARSEGDGAYSLNGGDPGTIKSTLTGIYPYAQFRLNGRVSFWGLAGAGSGSLTLTHRGRTPSDTDLGLRLGAIGVRGTLLEGGGLDLAIKSDALWVRTESDAATGLADTSAEVSRLRLILEGERPVALASGALLTPTAHIGLRRDNGDADNGMGVEVGAGIRYQSGVLTIEGQVRTLLAHEAAGYEEWGVSGAIRLSPNASGLGPSLAVMPAWGAAGSGVEHPWSHLDVSALASGSPLASPSGRLDAELGYGLPALHGRGVLTPYARVALMEGNSRSWHLGTRLALTESFNLSLEGSRRRFTGRDTAHDLTLRASVPW